MTRDEIDSGIQLAIVPISELSVLLRAQPRLRDSGSYDIGASRQHVMRWLESREKKCSACIAKLANNKTTYIGRSGINESDLRHLGFNVFDDETTDFMLESELE